MNIRTDIRIEFRFHKNSFALGVFCTPMDCAFAISLAFWSLEVEW